MLHRTIRVLFAFARQTFAIVALAAGALVVFWVLPAAADSPCTLDRAVGTTIDKEPLLRNGYGARWNFATNRVAYMQPGPGGYYRVFTMQPDGSDRRAITEGRAELPAKHQGAPYWHPSGRYLLFTAQKQEWKGRALFGNPDYEALPGFGRHDDLWLIAADGSRTWQLTNDPNTKDQGILLPVFAPDGKRVAWSARQPHGKYVIRVADFAETPQPHLQNIQSYQPGGAAYYEPGSFTSDSRSLLYTSDQDTHSFWRSQIYRLDLAGGKSTRLTAGDDYNEHPTVVSTPSGDWVIYMSTKGANRRPFHFFLGTDWYAMQTGGGNLKRLTTMNVYRKDNPENEGIMQVACTVAVSPSGDFMLGDVQDSLARQTGMVEVVRFTCP
jgi:Tol biopolymer transport system component